MAQGKEVSIGIKLVTDLKDFNRGFTEAGKNVKGFGKDAGAVVPPLKALQNELYALKAKQKNALSPAEWKAYQSEIDATKQKMADFTGGAGTGLKGLFNSFKGGMGFKGIGDELNSMAAAAGAAFAVTAVIAGIKAVGEYAMQISNTKKEVETLAGLHGAAADKMAGEATAISQAYDADVKESIKATNVLMKSFGTDSTDAFDLLNIGMSGAANAQGDLLEQVSEYSPHFAEAGLNAAEMFAVIQAGNQQGIFSDKAADSIKEGSIRMREMTKSTREAIDGLGLSSDEIQKGIANGTLSMFEAMQMVSNKLNEFPAQAPQVGAALADVFGGPGEDAVNFIRTMGTLDTSMAGLMASATEAQRAQMNYTAELSEFHTVGAQVFGGVGTMVTNIKGAFLAFANDAIKGTVSVINYFIDLYNESMILRGVIQGIGFAFKTAFGYVQLQLKQLINVFAGFGKVIKAVLTGRLGEVGDIIKDTFKKSGDNIDAYGAKVADNFAKGVENTLTPKKKLDLISLSTTVATEQGKKAGEAMGKATAEQMAKAFAGSGKEQIRVDGFVKLTGIEQGELKTKPVVEVGLKPMGKPVIDENALLKQSYAEINGAILGAQLQADALGESFDEVGMRKQLLAERIRTLIDSGLTPESAAISKLREEFQALGPGISTAEQLIGTVTQNIASSTAQGAESFAEFKDQVKNSVKETIGAFIAQGVAAMVAGALKSAGMTGPMGLILAPALAQTAGGLAKTAFNSIIPSFADGGIVYGETIARVAEYSGSRQNPEVISPLNKLKELMPQGGGSQHVQVEVVGNISNETIRLSNSRASKRVNRRG